MQVAIGTCIRDDVVTSMGRAFAECVEPSLNVLLRFLGLKYRMYEH